jgi:hypothetical protein
MLAYHCRQKTKSFPVELGRLDKGGVPLHVLGGQSGGLLFQNLVKLG